MADFTITLSSWEEKAMKTICADTDEWITNAAINRARQAKDDILTKLVAHCNENEIAIATGIEAQIAQALSLGVVAEATSETPGASTE